MFSIVKEPLSSPDITPSEDGKLFRKFFNEFGHTKGVEHGYENAIEDIKHLLTTKRFKYSDHRGTREYRFENVKIELPTTTPLEISEKGTGSYTIEIKSDMEVISTTLNGEITKKKVTGITWGDIPLLVGSKYDPISKTQKDEYGFTMAERNGLDPNVPPHFIINNKTMTFNLYETLAVNNILVYSTDISGDVNRIIAAITTETELGQTANIGIYMHKDGILKFSNFRDFSKGRDQLSLDVLDTFTLLGFDDTKESLADFILQFTKGEWRTKVLMILGASLEKRRERIIKESEDSEENKKYSLYKFLVQLLGTVKIDGLEGFSRMIEQSLYTHIGIGPEFNRRKMALLALQIVRLCETLIGLRKQNDRDSYGNKRFKNVGAAMFHLFGILINSRMDKFDNREWNSSEHLHDSAIRNFFSVDNVYPHFEHSFEKSWGDKSKPGSKKIIFAEKLKDEQYVLQHTHVDKVVRGRDVHSKSYRVRKVQGSQVRIVCLAETPESAKAGLNNTKAILEYNSQHRYTNILFDFLNKNYKNLIKYDEYARDSQYDSLFFVNGVVYGICKGRTVADILIKNRRHSNDWYDISINYNDQDKMVSIFTDAGRPMTPVLVVEDGEILLEKLGFDKEIDSNNFNIQKLKDAGVIDFVSVPELEWKTLAFSREELKSKQLTVAKINNRLKELQDILINIKKGQHYYRSILDPEVIVKKEDFEFEADKIISENIIKMKELVEKYEQLKEKMDKLVNSDDLKSFEDRYASIKGEIERTVILINRYDPSGIEVQVKEAKSISIEDLMKTITKTEEQLAIAKQKAHYDYCDIDPVSQMGITLSILPYTTHDPGPRQTFACKMAKQAECYPSFGYHWNPILTKYLIFPTRPPTETQTAKSINLHTHCIGIPVNIAIFSGQDTVEDMMLMSKGFIQRGGASSVTVKIVKQKIKNLGEEIRGNSRVLTRLGVPPKNKRDEIERRRPGTFRNIGSNGVIIPGSIVNKGDCLIAKYSEITIDNETKIKDSSIYANRTKTGKVTRVVFNQRSDTTFINIELDEYRTPERGDKFSNGHAQKSTIGNVIDDSEMIYSLDSGIIPDIVVNSHSQPSRMTVGMLLEIIYGKAHALTDKRYDATAFRKLESIDTVLEENGFKAGGKETFINPITGQAFNSKIYSGICYYYRLVHEAAPKLQNRYIAAYKRATHQPVTGIPNEGGQRNGEMEVETKITHGTSYQVKESWTRNSDYYIVNICSYCNTRVYRDINYLYTCAGCKRTLEANEILSAESTYTQELLNKYNTAKGFKMMYQLNPLDEEDFQLY